MPNRHGGQARRTVRDSRELSHVVAEGTTFTHQEFGGAYCTCGWSYLGPDCSDRLRNHECKSVAPGSAGAWSSGH